MIEPWAHGTVVRATRYPSYYDFNVVRVEEDPAMSVEALVAFADEALAGLEHRRFDFDVVERRRRAARRLRGHGLEDRAPGVDAPRVPAAARAGHRGATRSPTTRCTTLRVAWHGEDFPDQDRRDYHAPRARGRAEPRRPGPGRARGERPIAFAQLEHDGDAAEITQVFVHPDYRGGGRGTAMTRAAIEAAGDVRDLWIVADDEDRPKELYARLGFRPAWTAMEVTPVAMSADDRRRSRRSAPACRERLAMTQALAGGRGETTRRARGRAWAGTPRRCRLHERAHAGDALAGLGRRRAPRRRSGR